MIKPKLKIVISLESKDLSTTSKALWLEVVESKANTFASLSY